MAKGAPSYDHAAFVPTYTQDYLGHVIYSSGISESDWLQDLPRLAKETWEQSLRRAVGGGLLRPNDMAWTSREGSPRRAVSGHRALSSLDARREA